MVSDEFRQNLATGNVFSIRSALVDYLIVDKTFSNFDEALVEASKSVLVVEPYDGKPFENDRSKWDINYLNEQKVALMVNFSDERISHLKSVIKKVLPENTSVHKTNATADVSAAAPNRNVRRKVISETEIKKPASNGTSHSRADLSVRSAEPKGGNTKKTGKRIVSETETTTHSEKEGCDKAGTRRTVAGLAAVAAGGLAFYKADRIAAVLGADGIIYIIKIIKIVGAGAIIAGSVGIIVVVYNKLKK